MYVYFRSLSILDNTCTIKRCCYFWTCLFTTWIKSAVFARKWENWYWCKVAVYLSHLSHIQWYENNLAFQCKLRKCVCGPCSDIPPCISRLHEGNGWTVARWDKGNQNEICTVAVHGEGRTRFECTDEDARTVWTSFSHWETSPVEQ